MKPRRSGQVAAYVAASLLAALFLLPFYIIVRNAFSTQQAIVSPRWRWWPDAVDGSTLASVLGNPNLGIVPALVNSAVVSVAQTALTVVISLMAGYALARWRTRASKVVLGLTVFTLMVPAMVTFIPTFVMVSSLGWISSYRGLVVPVIFSAFATFMFRQGFLDFPRELEEAAAIDGANTWTTFWRIVVPNAMGTVAAVGTITFIGAWNAFLWPLLIAQDPQMRTIQVVLSQFMTSQGTRYPEMFTGALIGIVPALLVFVFLQRWLVQGVEQSGLK
ncbi:carbohydrate ABC transporter permease [Propioniciclava coleopterorum]|uniref:Carbohydrate ABC transporter permease n=1 Tax=Propioniciclava coleopterorum TaxID=2714937 RepID=A0A6G7Y5S6_9ACTN|nr:carbohydrate ABC transporter permease [Propioniciclava coleopterorum]QIK72133.1 carbohydrate ABC transporter permease [Propioniciclava coleopterorum]